MIEDIRWIIKSIEAPQYGEGIFQEVRVLQAYDGHVWFDVPVVENSHNPSNNL